MSKPETEATKDERASGLAVAHCSPLFMKPKITIEAYDIRRTDQSIRVLYNGTELVTAWDIDYESSDAKKCCELLAAMHRAGLIELEANADARRVWSEFLANVRDEPRHE